VNISRRGVLAGLLALPFVRPLARVAAAVKRRLFPVVYVGAGMAGEDSAGTLRDALAMVKPGGTIYLMPEHTETISEPMEINASLIGVPGKRPTIWWRQS
jgi:hypothetical protein